MHDDSWWTNVETFFATAKLDLPAESKVTFVTHCSISSEFMKRYHKFGVRCFPYTTLYLGSDDVQWGTDHFNAYEGVAFGLHNFYEIDSSGAPKKSPYGEPTSDGVGLVLHNCFITCPNIQDYEDRMAKWVEYIMSLGADGIFVDNLYARTSCYGARLGIHPHRFPDPVDPDDPSAQNRAFTSLLHRVRDVVKSYGADRHILGNSGDPLGLPHEFQRYLDSDMLEDYVCQGTAGRTMYRGIGITWDQVGRDLQAYLARKKQILVISSLDPSSSYGIAEDAFLCYASARLAGFIWTYEDASDLDADTRLNLHNSCC
jgi:hypothetical protein